MAEVLASKWSKQAREVMFLVLGVLIISGTISFLVVLMLREIPVGNKDAVMLSLGTLLASFTAVVGYYFGSSKGSADKNDTMERLKGGPGAPLAALLLGFLVLGGLGLAVPARATLNPATGLYWRPTQAEVDAAGATIAAQQATYVSAKDTWAATRVQTDWMRAYKFAIFPVQRVWLMNNMARFVYTDTDFTPKDLFRAKNLLREALQLANDDPAHKDGKDGTDAAAAAVNGNLNAIVALQAQLEPAPVDSAQLQGRSVQVGRSGVASPAPVAHGHKHRDDMKNKER